MVQEHQLLYLCVYYQFGVISLLAMAHWFKWWTHLADFFITHEEVYPAKISQLLLKNVRRINTRACLHSCMWMCALCNIKKHFIYFWTICCQLRVLFIVESIPQILQADMCKVCSRFNCYFVVCNLLWYVACSSVSFFSCSFFLLNNIVTSCWQFVFICVLSIVQ